MRRIFIFILLLMPYQALSQNQDSVDGDYQALVALYEATDGPNWLNNSGWEEMTPETMGNAYGIEVNGDGRVVSIKLNGTIGWHERYKRGVDGVTGGNNLRGELPAAISNLTEIIYFNVKQNYLEGSIPSLSNMGKLEYLLLNGRLFDPRPENRYHHPGKEHETASSERSNEYTGGFPELPTAGNLEILELLGNNVDTESGLSGNLNSSLSNQTSLRGLMIDYHNYLNGSLFDYIKELEELEQISVSNNSFSEIVPASINNTWSKIRYIQLGDNKFFGEFPELSGLSSTLYVLNVRGNDFTGNVEWIGDTDWANLITVRFDFNYDMSGTLPNTLFIDRVGRVTFSFNGLGLTGGFPQELTSWSGVQMNLGWNNFTGELPQTGWENYSNRLRTFRVSGSSLTGHIPAEMISAMDNSDLNRIYLNGNNFTSADPQSFANMQNGSVYLEQNNLSFKDLLLEDGTLPSRIADYGNQGPFGESQNISRPQNESVTLSFDIHHPHNSYQWYKDGQVISGATSHNYTINSMSSTYEGDYTLRVSNSSLSSLGTLESRTISLNVGEHNGGDDDDGSSDDPTTPAVPSLQSPSGGATNVSVTPNFSWSPVEADSYTLRVYTSGGSLVFENSGSGTSYSTPSSRTLDHDTEYSWSVRATRDGLTSDWSSSRSFTTESGGSGDDSSGTGGSDPLTSPDLTSPLNGANGVSLTPTLEWNSLDADYYILQLENTSTETLVVDTEVNGTSYSVKNNESLSSETLYKWRVRGVKDGIEGEWSAIAEFTTQAESGGTGNNGKGPQKSTPANDEKKVKKNATFTWESVEDAESYTIEVREASTSSLFVEEELADTVFVPGREMKGSTDYVWRVRATVQGQAGEWSDEWHFTTEEENEETVFEVELSQNYPNPFNPSTNIQFTIAEQQEVSLKVYDMAGRLVANLIDGSTLSAGTHQASFDAQSLASGIYFYRLITPSEIVTRKMTLMK